MENEKFSKTLRARELGVTRQSLYYRQKKPDKDWELKVKILEVLREHHSYGSRRVSDHLKLNRKRIKRVMNIFGIKPYRRRVPIWKRTKNIKVIYPNLLLTTYPQYENHIWVSDFTYIRFQTDFVYLATVLDLFTRKVVGFSVYTTAGVELTLSALMSAFHNNPRPVIFHSDNGSQYNAEIFIKALETVGTQISRSAPGCPWENGYQESFYSQFKIDLGDPDRFKNLGELVYEIYHQIYIYNNTRIHSAFRMSPVQFALKSRPEYN
jgi:transposase InsO family protein